MTQHQKNGFAVAKHLEDHDMIEKVLHPGTALLTYDFAWHRMVCAYICVSNKLLICTTDVAT